MVDAPRSIFATFREAALAHEDRPALKWTSPSGEESVVTYRELLEWVGDVALGFVGMGIEKGDRVALFADNRPEWIVADLALLAIGGVDVPRGTDTSPEELGFIVRDSGCRAAVVAAPKLALGLSLAVALDRQEEVPSLDEVRTRGKEASSRIREKFAVTWPEILEGDLATIIYTSGTTGLPKGVMLTHGNILHNVRTAPGEMDFSAGDIFLSVLPAWHVYERTVEYCVLAVGACLCYSKPTPQALVQDLGRYRPTAMVAVPRVWLSLKRAMLRTVARLPRLRRHLVKLALAISRWWCHARCVATGATARAPQLHTRVLAAVAWGALLPLAAAGRATVVRKLREAAMGNSLRLLVSGGAGLPPDVDLFFTALGLPILEGYGLTETSPIVSARRPGELRLGTVGPPLPEVEVCIADDCDERLGPSQLGRVLVRGPLIMKGYHNRPQETAEVIDAEGWFDTGDVGWLTPAGELVITGRAREMIVLMGGENVHPQPLERMILQSPLIAQVMVVGHGARVLGALVVPDRQALLDSCKGLTLDPGWASCEEIRTVFRRELRKLVGAESGLRPCERVSRFCVLEEPFKIGEELTHTLKVKRDVVLKKYRDRIGAMLGTGRG